MDLTPEFAALAEVLQEASRALSHGDIHSALSAHLSGKLPDGYVHSVAGDEDGGQVVYSSQGKTHQAPYSISKTDGKRTASIDVAKAKQVMPRMVYDAMERAISQDERDNADASDFAGKDRSFPILKKEDVSAAVHAMGRAGPDNHSSAALKANIIRIAKRKGWGSELPAEWTSGAKESAAEASGEVVLIESAAVFLDEIPLLESVRAIDYPIKLIAPGRGSSGYYTPEVLKRDGPTIFVSGTHMYWNHSTAAEESQRPEGNMDHLAAVLTSNAYYDESGKAGPGLYSRAKVFSDYGEKVSEKAPHTGLSIRAKGSYAEGKAPDGRGNLIGALTRGESVDFVTKPGAGGKVLLESARNSGGEDMDETVLKELRESNRALAEANKAIAKRLIRADAREAATSQLAAVELPAAARTRIIERALMIVPEKEGEFDRAALKTLVETEIAAEAAYLREISGGARIVGMGAAPTAELTEAQRAARDKEREKAYERSAPLYGARTAQGQAILREGRSAFDPEYNSLKEAVA